MANAGLGSEFYLSEINEVHTTLSALSRWVNCRHLPASSDVYVLDSGPLPPIRWPLSLVQLNRTIVSAFKVRTPNPCSHNYRCLELTVSRIFDNEHGILSCTTDRALV